MKNVKHFLTAIVIMANGAAFHAHGAVPVSEETETEPAPSGVVLTPERRAELDKIDMPVLNFTLKDGAFPDFECVMPPSGCIGTSITNNQYIEGQLVITRKGEAIYESGEYEAKKSGVRLKVRGNGSSNEQGHKSPTPSYKIKLSKKANILVGDESVSKSKDWVLLKEWTGHVKKAIGHEVGRVLGLGWQPRGYAVALLINGNYFGIYYLSEAISADKDRINISDTGFVIENDAYWWVPDEIYFKTANLPYMMGWTFKEPDTDDVPESTLKNIEEATKNFENALYAGPASMTTPLEDMMDVESVATWVLAHDIMNNQDPCGSNIYVIKDDLDPQNPYSTKFRMGPIWDLDGALFKQSDAFAYIHDLDVFWIKKLFEYQEFYDAYKNKWAAVKDTFHDDLMNALNERMKLMPGLQDAWRFAGATDTTEDAIKTLDDFITERLPVLDELIKNMQLSGSVGEITDSAELPAELPADGGVKWLRDNNAKVYSIDGIQRNELSKGLNIIRLDNGATVKRVY